MSRATLEARPANGIDPSAALLFQRWQDNHDERARELLVERFMPLARRLARKFHGSWDMLDDLNQVASVGLLNAIDRFDRTRGVTFPSYAVPTIIGELKRYLRDTGWAVHLPRSIQERAVRVEQAQRKLAVETGRNPTYSELAAYLEISVEEVLDAVEASAAHHAISFEAPRESDDEGGPSVLGDSLGKFDHGFGLVDDSVTIGQAAAHLTERERRVLALRFVAEETQSEIAAQVGLSQMQVSRILRQSLSRLETLMQPGAVDA